MIPRYSRAPMTAIWSQEQKFKNWLAIERAASESMEAQGTIPAGVAAAFDNVKEIDADKIDAIEAVHRGESAVSPEMTSKLVAAYRHAVAGAPASPPAPPSSQAPAQLIDPPEQAQPHPLARLSPRERDILREIARGASNKEIARTLDIAETTVKIHVQHILRKLGLTSRVQAAVYASDRQRAE